MGKQEDITRKMLERIRGIQESSSKSSSRLLREDTSDSSSNELENSTSVAITDDPKWGQNVLTSQIEQFRSSVESGAKFSKVEGSKVDECPLIFKKDDGNLIFSGVIPCLNNLKWQFVLKTDTGKGCFMWADGLILDRDNMAILNKLYGFYENWKEQWNKEASDLEKMIQNMDNK